MVRQLGEIGDRLLHAQPCVFALAVIHRAHRFVPLPLRTTRDGADHVQVAQQLFAGAHTDRIVLLDLPPGAQKQLRILDETFSCPGLAAPGRIQHADFLGGELMPGNLLRQPLAVVAFGTSHRHQVLHGRLGADLSLAHVLLDRLGQLLDQRQTARYPGNTPVEAPRQILKAEPEAAMQLRQKPSLLERGFSFRRAQRTVEHERFGFVHIPNRRPYGVLPQAPQGPDSLVAVNDQEAVGFAGQGNHDDRDLLAPFGQGSQKTFLALRTPDPKLLVT